MTNELAAWAVKPPHAEWWTGASFSAVPKPSLLPQVISACRNTWAEQRARDPISQIHELGWSIEMMDFDAALGGLQAVLLPVYTGGFRLIIDPNVTPEQKQAGLAKHEVIRWRIAHEYAHTFFFGLTKVSTQRIPSSLPQELFCDAFASAITNVETSSVTQAVVSRLRADG
jgi:hypothetical protein